MAVHAPITGASLRAPVKCDEISAPVSRRTLFGVAGGSIAAVALASVPAPSAANQWHAKAAAVDRARAQADAFYQDVLRPVAAKMPALPDLTERVGTHYKTGEPIYQRYDPAELEGDEPFVALPAWKRARDRWLSYKRQRNAVMTDAEYDALEDRSGELSFHHWQLQQEALLSPAPDLAALLTKIRWMTDPAEEHTDLRPELARVLREDVIRLNRARLSL